MLDHAWSAGVDTLDTANAYGESEQRLGEIGVGRWHVISKLPAVPESCADVRDWVEESAARTRARLGISSLRGLLLHRPEQLLGQHGRTLYEALTALKDRGLVEKIGISIYGPEELDAIWPRFALDIVQSPFNVLDRRLATSGWLSRLHASGAEVHVRSVFLQGLLLMDDSTRPPAFNRWRSVWDRWSRWLDDRSRRPLEACLSVAWSRPEIDRVIVGVDSLIQLKDILACAGAPGVAPPDTLASDDPDLINPSHWNAH